MRPIAPSRWTLRTRQSYLGGVKIYTRTGDAGETSLMGAGRVAKDHLRVAAYGDVDEANAAIGLALTTEPRDFAEPLLSAIQRDLFAIGGALATPAPERVAAVQRAKVVVPPERIADLERAIDAADAELPALTAFILPGGTPKAAALHAARTICRRAERTAVRLAHDEPVPAEVLVYLNRLSDLLFTLARLANRRAGIEERTW
jgi:cob(I)alamin adenosyltransferase